MTTLRTPIDWRQCEYVSLSNAGRIAGKSATWARGAICTGDLQAVRLPNGGAEVITVQSLVDFLGGAHPVRSTPAGPTGPLSRTIH